MADERATALIKGRVQGVYFRAYTRDMARDLGLTGFVRNLPLMRVEAVFEGPRDLIEKALEWCHQGSPNAQVTEVQVSWDEARGDMAGFEIRY